MKPQINHQSFAQKLAHLGNFSMAVALLGLILATITTYSFETTLPLSVLVIGHIAIIIFATVIKLGYIMRCAGLNEQGVEQL